MTLITLHPEVEKFLNQESTIYTDSSGVEAYIVNNIMYVKTNEKGVYSVTYLSNPPEEDTFIN